MTAPGRLAAPVSGWAAFVVARILDHEMPRRMLAVRAEVERGRLTDAQRDELLECWASIREAAAAWVAARVANPPPSATADSAVSADPAEVVAESREIDTATAAELLWCTTRRVRQMAADGTLPGRQVTRRGHLVWLVDQAAVLKRRQEWASG